MLYMSANKKRSNLNHISFYFAYLMQLSSEWKNKCQSTVIYVTESYKNFSRKAYLGSASEASGLLLKQRFYSYWVKKLRFKIFAYNKSTTFSRSDTIFTNFSLRFKWNEVRLAWKDLLCHRQAHWDLIRAYKHLFCNKLEDGRELTYELFNLQPSECDANPVRMKIVRHFCLIAKRF